MTTLVTEASIASFLRYLASGEDPDGFVSPDAVAEMTFPHVTFHLAGKAELDAARNQVSDQPWELEVREVVPTADGFVVVAGITTRLREGGSMRAHTATLVALDPRGRLARMQHWCSGAM